MTLRCLATAALLIMIAASIWADETGENPEYVNWSRFTAGASVTLRSTSENLDDGSTTVVTKSATLIEVGKEKVVVEVYYISEGTGRPAFKTKPKNQEILRTVALPKGVGKEEFENKMPGTIEEGTETVKTPHGEFATRWYKTKVNLNGISTEGKTWVCDDVPGRVVKVESKTKGPKSSYTTMTELIDIKKP